MPRVNSKWRADADRARYYRLRAEKLERENAEFQKDLIPTKQIESDLEAFAAAISAKIGSSSLEPNLQAELFDDLADLPHRLSVNGIKWKSNTNRGTPVTAFIAALSAPESHGKELAEQFMEIPDPQVGQVKIKEEKQPEKSC